VSGWDQHSDLEGDRGRVPRQELFWWALIWLGVTGILTAALILDWGTK
jgi:hypothetical protein